MNLLIRGLVLFLCLGSASIFAGENSANNCGKLSVSITNSGEEQCQLVERQLNHGYFTYSSLVPVVIPAHSTAHVFVLTQSVFGPDIDLTYQCGKSRRVTIHSQQDLCLLSAGHITGSILGQRNMTAWSVASMGSYLWNQHGSIHWAFE